MVSGIVLTVYCGWIWWKAPDHKPPIPPILHRAFPYKRDWYLPRIRDDVKLEEWDGPQLIHVVHTRFMQEQPSLTSLGRARLGLFRVFCLPTMIEQTTNHFLWIIKTDPDLDAEVMQVLVDLVSPYPNFFLVASNVNFRINEDFPGAWRDGAQARDLALSRTYTGNQTLLEVAMALEAQLPILETRLDADDGLHVEFLEQMQYQATKAFRQSALKWMYWCTRRHMEWHWIDEVPSSFEHDSPLGQKIVEYGALQGVQHSNLCITAGYTVGFPVGVSEPDVPVYPHQDLVSMIRKLPSEKACGLKPSEKCLQFVEEHIFEAVRSRTHTSAGMLKVRLEQDGLVNTPWLSYAYWDLLCKSFEIQRMQVRWMNEYLTSHIIDIARDNLLGQCTLGHSCKDSAKEELAKVIEKYRNRTTSG